MIAAGEVVERPASVVKELVENSIDAGATKITVFIKNGGIDEITVTDNGQGMSAEDAELAFTQHATSKISSAADLENIFTLGFRGEALASISSVSRVELDTKTETTPATKVVVENSQVTTKTSTKTTTGTTIGVFDLFKHIPARKKFLRTPATELNHVQEMFISLALVNLQVHFELIHNDKLLLRLPAVDSFNERVFAIWNAQIAENLYESNVEIPGGKIHLYIGKPEAGRKDRKLQYLFVNKRHVSDRILSKAVAEGYTGFLPKEIYPVYFIMLELDPKVVDVNVHPRKLEVRFDNSGQIFGAVKNAVSGTLTTNTKRDLMSRVSGTNHTTFSPTPNVHNPKPTVYSGASVGKQPSAPKTQHLRPKTISQSLSFTQMLLQEPSAISEPTQTWQQLPQNLFQIFNTYIVYPKDEEVVFIDQHAAAEKILYEKFRGQLDHARSRPLLTPQIIELRGAEKQHALDMSLELSQMGIEISDFGNDAIQVTALPELTPHLDVEHFLQELNDRTIDDVEANPDTEHKISDSAHLLIATLACHGSIRAGQRLNLPEMQNLVQDLAKCEYPYNCPHGRPVSWTLSRYELEKQFKRVI